MKAQSSLLLIAVFTLVLSVWTGGLVLRGMPYFGMELLASGNVHSVDPHGPAAALGLQIGDHVREIDGRPFLQTPSLAARYDAGDQVTVTTHRAGVRSSAALTLSSPTDRERVFSIERFLIGLIFFLVSTAILMLRPDNLSVRLFFLLSQVIAALCFGEILDPHIPAMSLFTDLGRILLVPLLLHFFVTFPRPASQRLRKVLLTAAYASAGVIAAFYVYAVVARMDLYADDVWMVPRAFELIVLMVALGVFLRPFRDAPLSELRRRRMLLAGMLIGFVPVLITVGSMVLRGGEPLVAYEWSLPAMAFIPLAYGYAVYRDELQRADLILNRGMVYFLLSVLLLVTYGAIFWAVDLAFAAGRGLLHVLVGAALVVAGSALFGPLRRRLQRWVDRLFYGGWYDYRSFVQLESERLSQCVDLDQLVEQLRTAARTMRFQGGAILWPRDRYLVARGGFGFDPSLTLGFRIPSSGKLKGLLEQEARLLTRDEMKTMLAGEEITDRESMLIESKEISHLLPLVSRGVLRSVLIVGRRQGDESLGPDDEAILSTLATQAAIACENIELLESLRERLAEVEQVRDELAEAQARMADGREEERLHLARELHDGPVQDLYAMLHETELIAGEVVGGADAKHVDSLRDTAQRVARTLREICIELRPPLLADLGLDVAIRSFVANVRESAPKTKIHLDLVPHGEDLPERTQLALFRVCQEAVHNAVQHGDAANVWIRFEADAEQILLQIRDDGRGFDVPDRWIEFGRRGHLGLMGIAERADAVGGKLDVESSPGRGTTLRVAAPAPEPGQARVAPGRISTRRRHDPDEDGSASAQPAAESGRR